MSESRVVPIDEVVQSDSQLREVDETSESFLSMVESMKEPSGLINPISVRLETNAETKLEEYVLVDGAHRLAACRAAGFPEIQVNILDLSELEAQAAQIIGNIHRVETKAYQFGKQLQRMLAIQKDLTVDELARMCAKSTGWVKQRLSLDKLDADIGKQVDSGAIDLNAAGAIARLPQSQQFEWAERAITADSTLEFVESVNVYIKAQNKARKEGLDASTVEYTIVPKLRPVTALKAAIDDPSQVIAALPAGDHDISAIIALSIQWALQIDPTTRSAREAAHAEKEAQRKAQRAATGEEAKSKKVTDLAAKLKKAQEELAIAAKAKAENPLPTPAATEAAAAE